MLGIGSAGLSSQSTHRLKQENCKFVARPDNRRSSRPTKKKKTDINTSLEYRQMPVAEGSYLGFVVSLAM